MHTQTVRGVAGGIHQLHGVVGKVHLHVQRRVGLADAIERRLRVIVRAVHLPHRAGPCRLRHPDHAATVGVPQVRVHAFVDRLVVDVVEELDAALELLERIERPELQGNLAHELVRVATFALVPVVIGPCIADGPAIGRSNGVLECFACGER